MPTEAGTNFTKPGGLVDLNTIQVNSLLQGRYIAMSAGLGFELSTIQASVKHFTNCTIKSYIQYTY